MFTNTISKYAHAIMGQMHQFGRNSRTQDDEINILNNCTNQNHIPTSVKQFHFS